MAGCIELKFPDSIGALNNEINSWCNFLESSYMCSISEIKCGTFRLLLLLVLEQILKKGK